MGDDQDTKTQLHLDFLKTTHDDTAFQECLSTAEHAQGLDPEYVVNTIQRITIAPIQSFVNALITRYDRLRFAYANVLKERRRWIERHDNLKQRVEDLEAELVPLKASHEARAKILRGLERNMRESFAIRSDEDNQEYKKRGRK